MTRSCLVFFVFVFGGYCLCFQWILQTHHVELSYVFLCGLLSFLLLSSSSFFIPLSFFFEGLSPRGASNSWKHLF